MKIIPLQLETFHYPRLFRGLSIEHLQGQGVHSLLGKLFQCLPTLQEGICSIHCRGTEQELCTDRGCKPTLLLEVAKDGLERLKWLKRLKMSLLEPSSDLWLKPGVVLKPVGVSVLVNRSGPCCTSASGRDLARVLWVGEGFTAVLGAVPTCASLCSIPAWKGQQSPGGRCWKGSEQPKQ